MKKKATKKDFNALTCAPKNIHIESIIELAEKNLSYSEIGKILGCSKEAICQRLKRHGYTPTRLKEFKKGRADTFALMQNRIVQSINEADIKKASLLQRVTALAVLYDKERLETGQSTSNISIFEHIVEESHRNPPRYT